LIDGRDVIQNEINSIMNDLEENWKKSKMYEQR
jgi:hypothetical protein